MIEYNTYKEEEEAERNKKGENKKEEISIKVNQVSKWNSLKHGILRNSVSKYDDIDIETLYNNLKEELSPSNTLEAMCLEIIVNNYVKINRIQKSELEKMKAILDPTIEFDFEPLIYISKGIYQKSWSQKYSRYSYITGIRLTQKIEYTKP